ncbi:MAG TPA: helicase-related protein, partial [Pyrinomonadaceae bacterium]|nr:helicase-related protein [Pyrinomonadaceae bacterium]
PMTGSPAPEEPTDVWAISALASPDRVPKHFGEFRDMTMVRVSQFKWEPRKNAEQIVADMLRGTVVRFTRDECFDLPPTVVHTHEVAMTAEQKKLIDTLRKEAAAEVAAGLIKGVNEAVVISKMLQVTSGAVKAINADKVETIHQVDCAPKFQALQELMDATSGPVIVFADFIGAIARLAQYAEINKVPYSMVVGDTPGAKRKAIFDAVQRNEIKMLVAHPKTIAHGVDLTTSNVIAWWNPIYSHEIYEQACGRITRATQRRKTLIVHFVCSALEKLVLRKLTKKSRVQGLLLDYLQGEA